MDSLKDSITFWATILGTLVGLFGVIQSRAWLAVIGMLVACASIGTLIYAERQRALVKSAAVRIGDRSLDSLNLASLQRRLNRSLVIQRAENEALIDGEDLTVTWTCSGYCRADRETVIEFSIDADANTPFDVLECSAFDLQQDPNRLYPIRPMLVGPDGISKKIAVPLLAALSAQEPFHIILKYRLPQCMKVGIEYYTATLSFEQNTVPRYSARLKFLHGSPQWLRVYERRFAATTKLLKELPPSISESGVGEYMDAGENVSARCARIYMFSRPSLKSSAPDLNTPISHPEEQLVAPSYQSSLDRSMNL